jgi:hypothetical protein
MVMGKKKQNIKVSSATDGADDVGRRARFASTTVEARCPKDIGKGGYVARSFSQERRELWALKCPDGGG